MEDARVRAENERKRMQGLTEEESGRGAATVYRNRATGGVVQASERRRLSTPKQIITPQRPLLFRPAC